MKKTALLILFIPLINYAQLPDLFKKKTATPENSKTEKSVSIGSILENLKNGTTANIDIAAGLKEALNNGITEQVAKLTLTDGFYKNELVKIMLPEELQKVDKALRSTGMSSLADNGVKMLNRAAEEAAKEVTPIFVDAVKNMSFNNAKNILLGNENAATTYLQEVTTSQLRAKCSPIIQSSLGKVGADKIWSEIITMYNTIPLVTKVNPDLNGYVTDKTLEGVFKMISVEEKNIRTNISSRNSGLLQKVFALQDKK